MNVQMLKAHLNEMLSKLSDVDDTVEVCGIDRLKLTVCNEDGMDVHHPKVEDKTVDFINIEVDMSPD